MSPLSSLSLPRRSVADTRSFPVDPDAVNRWLSALDPLGNRADAHELHRGLKHSNRLHNDLDQRRAVLARFIPMLRDVHDELAPACRGQALPLGAEFQRTHRLLDSLLREEILAFKILLNDSEQPRHDDLRRALQALVRRAELSLHSYQNLPPELLLDAHRLYCIGEQHGLLDVVTTDGVEGERPTSASEHYVNLLLLSLADPHQQRIPQLPLVMDDLRRLSVQLRVSATLSAPNTEPVLHIDLQQGARPVFAAFQPVPASSPDSPDDAPALPAGRFLHLGPVLDALDEQIARIRQVSSPHPGADILERQSVARLRVALTRERQRRQMRTIDYGQRSLVFGHKAICAGLLFRARRIPDDAATPPADESASASAAPGNDVVWQLRNASSLGLCLQHNQCPAGLVQVGDLVSTDPVDASGPDTAAEQGRVDTLLSVVRWVRTAGEHTVRIGIEHLARGVLPVTVQRSDDPDGIGESALIIACKVQGRVLQTLLLPPYLYQVGDQLTASLNQKARRIRLHRCLQSNGLFSHFSLKDDFPA